MKKLHHAEHNNTLIKRKDIFTIIQLSPDKAPQNTENEDKKVYVEFIQGNVLTYFSIRTKSIFPNKTIF
jgi:hypothetical protein